MPLHGLPDPLGFRLSHQRPRSTERINLKRRTTKDLCKDCRKRRQACPGLLPRVRHADLCGSRNRPSNIQYPRGHGAPASRATAESTRVVPIRARLGYGSAFYKTVCQTTKQLGQMLCVVRFWSKAWTNCGTPVRAE